MSQHRPLLILGPCLMESQELYFSTASSLVELLGASGWLYKASFDKANRTSRHSKRGPGLIEALDWINDLKVEFPTLRLTTDVHETWQLDKLVGLIDCIQIPAFLCRQTDLLVEAGRMFSEVNIKKGQWMAPDQTPALADKIRSVNPNAKVYITERGTFFGYGHLTVDFGAVDFLHNYFDRVILDCTHSTQRAGAEKTAGDRRLGERYFRAAPLFGYNGLFAEVHPNPKNALSDSESQIELDHLPNLLNNLDTVISIG